MAKTPTGASLGTPSNQDMGLIISPGTLGAYKSKFGDDHVKVETPTPFQNSVLLRREKEIALLGGKFGGKSWVARAFLLKGNTHLPNFDRQKNSILVNQSYIYH